MDSDNQKKIEEQTLEPKQIQASVVSASPALIKFFEILLSILCLSLILIPYDNRLYINVHRAGFVYVSFIMPICVDIVLLISHFRGYHPSKISLYMFSSLFAICFITAGFIIVCDWWTLMRSVRFHPPKMFMDMMISSGVFSLICSLFSFVNLYLTYKYY